MNQYGLTGRGIGIAMLDTGIFPHMDFDNRIICFRISYMAENSPMMTMDTERIQRVSQPGAEPPVEVSTAARLLEAGS